MDLDGSIRPPATLLGSNTGKIKREKLPQYAVHTVAVTKTWSVRMFRRLIAVTINGMLLRSAVLATIEPTSLKFTSNSCQCPATYS